MNLAEVIGPLAIRDFLVACSSLSPDWARQQLYTVQNNDTLGNSNLPLFDYRRLFGAHVSMAVEASKHGGPSVFTTLGTLQSGTGNNRSPARGNGGEKVHTCPCRDVGERVHRWPPNTCATLKYVVTGSTGRQLSQTPNKQQVKAIKSRL